MPQSISTSVRSLKVYQDVVDSSPCAVMLLDSSKRILSCNTHSESIFGYTRKELEGIPFSLLVPTEFHGVSLHHKQGINLLNSTKLIACYGVGKDGTTLPLTTSWHCLTNQSEQCFMVYIFPDEIIRGDEILFELGQGLMQTVTDHISIVGKNYRYCKVNRTYELTHGISQGNMIGMHIADVLSSEFFEDIVKQKFENCLKGNSIEYEAEFTFKETGKRMMRVNYYPLTSEEGHINHVGVIKRDITYLTHLEDTLHKIQSTLFEQRGSQGLSQKLLFESLLMKKPENIHTNQMKLAQLTSQERIILARVAEGKTNKEIAGILGLSDKTIRNYLTKIFKKLQVSRRPEAASFFVQTLSEKQE